MSVVKRCIYGSASTVCLSLGVALSMGSVATAHAASAIISNERSGDLLFMSESGETEAVVPLCARPRGMAQHSDGQRLFIACSDDAKVVEFEVASRQILQEFAGLDGAMSLALHEPSHRLVVSNEGQAQATVLDVRTGAVLATLPTGLEPDGVGITDDGSRIFVVSENASLIHAFDGASYQPIKQVLTNLRPRRLAVRGDELWVSSEMGSRVEIFDSQNLDKMDEIIFAPRGFRLEQLTPVDILFNHTQELAFVALGSANHVAIVDTKSRDILKYILVGRRPWGLGLSPDGNSLYVLNGLSDDVTIIDVAKQRPVKTRRTGLVPHSVEIVP